MTESKKTSSRIILKSSRTIGKSSSNKQQKYKLDQKAQPSVFQIHQYKGQSFIESLAFMLIRPPRFSYNSFLLNPSNKIARYTLQTHPVQSENGTVFQLSLYKQKKIDYVILYLHGNASSKLQAFLALKMFPENVAIACFDFNGCGNRPEGNFVTLGKRQAKEVDIAARYLKNLGYKVVGWGRSMGAASLLLSNQIQIMVADSSYSSLQKVCQESKGKVIPSFLSCFASCFYPMFFEKVKNKVFQLTELSIDQMQIVEKLKQHNNLNKQICFIHGQEDDFVSYTHSQNLYQAFQGRKQFVLFEGTHNSDRSVQVFSTCIEFIQQSFDLLKLRQMQMKAKLRFTNQNKQEKTCKKVEQLNSLKKRKIILPKTQNNQTSNSKNYLQPFDIYFDDQVEPNYKEEIQKVV